MSKLNVLFVADIFGTSTEFYELCQQVSSNEMGLAEVSYHAIGPYESQPHSFKSEQDAYQYFSKHVGVEVYSKKVQAQLAKIHGPKLLIGFSVGGSAIWQLMPSLKINDVISVVCFYSSQIRHFSHVLPTVPCRLIFPKQEVHFSVNDLIEKLQVKPQVKCEKFCYQHGFLNKLSPNYSAEGSRVYIPILQTHIHQAVKS